jgi:hypothetical protein
MPRRQFDRKVDTEDAFYRLRHREAVAAATIVSVESHTLGVSTAFGGRMEFDSLG